MIMFIIKPDNQKLSNRNNICISGLTWQKIFIVSRALDDFRDGDVAQLVEHLICIQDVAGSIPVISTIKKGTLCGFFKWLSVCRTIRARQDFERL